MQFSLYGSESATISVGGHYIDIDATPELDTLYKELPSWIQGAEFIKFASAVEIMQVAPKGCRGTKLSLDKL